MYKIFADNTLIYDSTLDDYKIGKGNISLEINKSGSFVFSVYPDHFYYDSFVKLKTVITVYRSGKIVFRGRILNDVTDHWNNKVITCEGELGFLQDSIIRPFEFNGSPVDLFIKFINEHNSQVDDFKKFKIGVVTVAGDIDYIYRSNSEYASTLDNLNGRLIGESLGGFFYITHDDIDEIPTINYLADSIKTASQSVEFGSNLKNYTKTVKAEELATAIIPLGKDKLTITSVNSGRDYVYSAEGVELYGWIFKTVSWDDVTNASNLKSKAQAYLNNVVTQNVTVELNAIDLHLLDRSIESFNVCDYVRVTSIPHNFDSTLLCNRQTLDLLKPENDTLILGYAKSTITGRTNEVRSSIKALQSETKTITSSVRKINDDYVKTSDLNDKVNEYLESDAGKSAIESQLSANIATKDDLTGFITETELSTSIGQYIDSDAGTAKIVTAVSGTYARKDSLGNYVLKNQLSTEIGSYIDTQAGTAKIVSAVSGEYQTKSGMSDYQTKSGMSDYAKVSAVSTIEQSVSNVEAAITLSSTYSKNTIGTNVYALLQLVSDANSSNIKIKADKIDFEGFTTFLRASDLGSNGSTTIDGGRIKTGTISADRIDTTTLALRTLYGKGTYSTKVILDTLVTSTSLSLYLGGESIVDPPSATAIYIMARNSGYICLGNIDDSRYIRIDLSVPALHPIGTTAWSLGASNNPWRTAYIGNSSYYWTISNSSIIPNSTSTSYFDIGSSTYPANNVYVRALYIGGTKLDLSGYLKSTNFSGSNVYMGGTTSNYIVANTSYHLRPSTSSSYYPFYLGTSSYYWHYAYIGSTQTIIGSSSSSKLGFFGSTGATRQTVSNSATVATLITALKAYGLIY